MKLQPAFAPSSIDPAHCPLCGQSNRCAMELEKETGLQQPPCWCTTVAFNKSVLAQIPAASRGQACICVACASQVDTVNAT